MTTPISHAELNELAANGAGGYDEPADANDEDHAPGEDPLTGLPLTEAMLPLVANWAGTSSVHAICLHFVGLGILANLPQYQASPSLLREATDRLVPVFGDDDRLTRLSGNELVIFTKRPEPVIRPLLVEIADRLGTFGTDVDGRHLPEVRVGMAMMDRRGASIRTPDVVNALVANAAGVTVPMADVVTTREPAAPPSAPAPADAPAMEPQQPAAPRSSEQILERDEEMETMMIRGHQERTPIRPAGEPSAPATAPVSAPPSDHRLILKAVDVAVTGLVATAVIDLDFEGRRVRGKAIGRSSDGHHAALVGEALTRAVTDLLPAGHGAVFRQAVPAATDVGEVVVTVVEFLTPDHTEYLFGVAPVEGEPVAGMARSILDAVNHRTARLLETTK